MKELSINEISVISGGEFTNLEIVLGSGFVGTALGATIGAVHSSNQLLSLFAPQYNQLLINHGVLVGAPIGCVIGLGLGAAYSLYSAATR